MSARGNTIFDLLDTTFSRGGRRPWQIVVKTLLLLGFIKYGTKLLTSIRENGFLKTLTSLVGELTKAAGVTNPITAEIKKQTEKLQLELLDEVPANVPRFNELPEAGLRKDAVLKLMTGWAKKQDTCWNQGKVSGTVYHGGSELQKFAADVYGLFSLDNPLHPSTFPYTRKMEAEIVRMTLNLFHGDENAVGNVTSGGTESILVAMKCYRDKARKERGVTKPEMVCCLSAHAAFNKAAAYFGIKLVGIPIDRKTFKMDINKTRRAINSNTVVLVGSAVDYPHGICDDIGALSDLAVKHNIPLHVDSCLGSFIVPYVQDKMGKTDFVLPGVTSISCDTHKYGYAPKGTSVVMFRNNAIRRDMYFSAVEWMGGLYASPTVAGSRPGSLVAATWATMVHIGRKGYEDYATTILETSNTMQAGVKGIPDLEVCGKPYGPVFAVQIKKGSKFKESDIFKISDCMKKSHHWDLSPLQNPPGMHISVTYPMKTMADQFVKDLKDSVREVKADPKKWIDGTSATVYGAATAIAREYIDEVAFGYLDGMTITDFRPVPGHAQHGPSDEKR